MNKSLSLKNKSNHREMLKFDNNLKNIEFKIENQLYKLKNYNKLLSTTIHTNTLKYVKRYNNMRIGNKKKNIFTGDSQTFVICNVFQSGVKILNMKDNIYS
jgi:hypothetical protein